MNLLDVVPGVGMKEMRMAILAVTEQPRLNLFINP